MTIAWAPRASASTAGEIALAIGAASPDGASYFTTSHTTSREVSFDAPAGELVLTTTALNARGEEIDADKRRITVPAFDGSRLAIGSPMVFRARTARDVRAFSEGTGAHPEVGREFDRTDRLFIRFPVYGGPEIAAAARLLNRRGTELRALPATPRFCTLPGGRGARRVHSVHIETSAKSPSSTATRWCPPNNQI